jgi:tetratricopeptide (TPR) repeat protein
VAAVDRDSILKRAEKLLRQGKVDGAIEEYVRLVEAYPKDWNTINALGDLYARAGDVQKAVAQYARVADHLFTEGFYPKAAALYKKALKLKSDDERLVQQLAEIAGKQGLLADAKLYFRQLSSQYKARGDERSAAEALVRLGSLEIADAESRVAAARAAQQLGSAAQAASLLKAAADDLTKAKRPADALELLVDAARLDPEDHALRTRLAKEYVKAGDLERARPFLTIEATSDDPALLLVFGRMELAAGRDEQARIVFMRLLMTDATRADEIQQSAVERARAGHLDSAFGCLEVVADNALLIGDPERAVVAVQSFLAEAPSHVRALQRLVELCVDNDIEGPLLAAQRQLADAHLEAGQAAEARFIAEDLLDRDPTDDTNIIRLRRALQMLGIPDPDKVIADRIAHESEAPEVPPVPNVLPAPDALEALGALEALEALQDDAPVILSNVEVDLSAVLAELGSPPVQPVQVAATPPPDLEEVFAGIRSRIARDQQRTDADTHYDRALAHVREGRVEEAITDLQEAARVPMLRFMAGSQLGRLFIRRGDLKAGVDWLERAAEAPAPTANEGFALLYDLADALEQMGELARALAILMELETDSPDYRDIRPRIERLSRAQAGSPAPSPVEGPRG